MSAMHDAVWKAWKTDEFMAPREKHYSELKGKVKADFEKHVSDVKAHAEKHRIEKPEHAIRHYVNHIATEYMNTKKEEVQSSAQMAVDAAAKRHAIAKRALAQQKLKQTKDKHNEKMDALNKDIRSESSDLHVAQDLDAHAQAEPRGSAEREARRQKLIARAKLKPNKRVDNAIKANGELIKRAKEIIAKQYAEQ